MPDTRLNELIQRLELVAKLGCLLKWIVLAIFGAGGWLTMLQFEMQANKQAIAEVQADRKEHIKASEEWHRQKDKEDSSREQIISQIVKIQDHQQGEIEKLLTK